MFHEHGSNAPTHAAVAISSVGMASRRTGWSSRRDGLRWISRFVAVALLVAVVLASPLQAQTVTISEDGVRTDGKPILLVAPAGNSKANHVHLAIVNHRRANVCYKLRLRDGSKFVNFHGDHDVGDIAFPFAGELDGDNDRRDVFSAYLVKQEKRAGIYHDEIGIEVWDRGTNRRLGYVEVCVIASVRTRSFPRQRPEGYAMWTNDAGQLQRVRLADLPLRVYSNDPEQARIVHRATSVWNEAGRNVGLEKDFFLHISDRRSADLTIDWSGRDLPRDAAGAAMLRISPSQTVIAGVVMRPASDEAKVGETLVQELGHLLGLEHSSAPNDIMAPTVHQHWHDSLKYVEVTQRDLSALWWLYQQPRYVPIVAARNGGMR